MRCSATVQAFGYAAKDPETRTTSSGFRVTSFSLGVFENWKDKRTGEDKSRVQWIPVDCFDKLADVVAQYVRKNDPLYIEGSWVTDTWEKNGEKHSRTKVRATRINFLRGKSDGGSGNGGGQYQSGRTAQTSQPEISDAAEDYPFEEDFPLDFDSLSPEIGGADTEIPF
jgi:single-strand DNA-binding protein